MDLDVTVAIVDTGVSANPSWSRPGWCRVTSSIPRTATDPASMVANLLGADGTNSVARVELIGNGKVVARDTTPGYVLSVNTSRRTMKVQIRAYDRVGNGKHTSARTWYRK